MMGKQIELIQVITLIVKKFRVKVTIKVKVEIIIIIK